MDADETQNGADGGESQPQAEVENTPEAQTNGPEETGEVTGGEGGGGAEQTEIKSEDSPPVETIATEDVVAAVPASESEAAPPENQAQAETDGINVEPSSADAGGAELATEPVTESIAPTDQEGQAADRVTTETTDPEQPAVEGAVTEQSPAATAAAEDAGAEAEVEVAADPEAPTTEPEEAAENGGEPGAAEPGEAAANVEEEQNAVAADSDPQEQDGGEKEAEGAELEGEEPIIADEGAEDQADQQQGDAEHEGEDVQPKPEIEKAEVAPDAGNDEAAPGEDVPEEDESSKPVDEDESRDDGPAVHAKPPARFSVTADQPPSQKKPITAAPPVSDKKHKKTYPHLARPSKEKKILNAIRKPAAPHDYFGLIFSAESKRPPTYYHNYFLPVQKQPLKQQHMKVVGKVIPPDAINTFIKAPLHSMPLSSVKVRWMLNRRNTIYKASDLYAYLSKYGKIEHVYQLSNNSALVVFDELLAALAVVKDPSLGYPWDPLYAEWLEPRLNNRGYFKKHANVSDSPLVDHGYIHNNIHNKCQPKCT